MTAVPLRVDPHAVLRDCAVALRVKGWTPGPFSDVTTTWTGPGGQQVTLSRTATTARIAGPGFVLQLGVAADQVLFALVLGAAIGGLQ